jgi:hypothetical protein
MRLCCFAVAIATETLEGLRLEGLLLWLLWHMQNRLHAAACQADELLLGFVATNTCAPHPDLALEHSVPCESWKHLTPEPLLCAVCFAHE